MLTSSVGAVQQAMAQPQVPGAASGAPSPASQPASAPTAGTAPVTPVQESAIPTLTAPTTPRTAPTAPPTAAPRPLAGANSAALYGALNAPGTPSGPPAPTGIYGSVGRHIPTPAPEGHYEGRPGPHGSVVQQWVPGPATPAYLPPGAPFNAAGVAGAPGTPSGPAPQPTLGNIIMNALSLGGNTGASALIPEASAAIPSGNP
jgi:hypothetical protein